MKTPEKITVPNDWPKEIEYEWLKVMPITREEALEIQIKNQQFDIDALQRFLTDAEHRIAKLELSLRVANTLRRSDKVLARYGRSRSDNV